MTLATNGGTAATTQLLINVSIDRPMPSGSELVIMKSGSVVGYPTQQTTTTFSLFLDNVSPGLAAYTARVRTTENPNIYSDSDIPYSITVEPPATGNWWDVPGVITNMAWDVTNVNNSGSLISPIGGQLLALNGQTITDGVLVGTGKDLTHAPIAFTTNFLYGHLIRKSAASIGNQTMVGNSENPVAHGANINWDLGTAGGPYGNNPVIIPLPNNWTFVGIGGGYGDSVFSNIVVSKSGDTPDWGNTNMGYIPGPLTGIGYLDLPLHGLNCDWKGAVCITGNLTNANTAQLVSQMFAALVA